MACNSSLQLTLYNNTPNNTIVNAAFISCSWAVVLLLSESSAIIDDLDVILHGFMLQIIYTTVFRVKWLNNLMLCVRLFNCLTRKIVV